MTPYKKVFMHFRDGRHWSGYFRGMKERAPQGQNFDAFSVSEPNFYAPGESGCFGKTTQLFIIISKTILNSISA